MAASDAERTEAIRRRVQREYVVVTAPRVLDGSTTPALVETLETEGVDCDVVIDLRAVEVCEAGVVDLLDRASRALEGVGARVTLSHPSPPFDAVLAGRRDEHGFTVRRPRTPRPLRHSMRGEL